MLRCSCNKRQQALLCKCNGLEILNISNPVSPVFMGSYNPGVTIKSICVSGNYAYLATDGQAKLDVVNVSAPSNPYSAGKCSAGLFLSGNLSIVGGFAFMAENRGVQIFNIYNPALPVTSGPGIAQM